MPLILSTFVILCWSTTWFALKLQAPLAPVEQSVFYRMLLASALLLIWCKFRNLKISFSLKNHLFLAMLGFFNFSMNYIIVYEAAKILSSGVNSLVFSLILPINLFNSALFFKTTIKPYAMVVAVMGLVGLGSVFWPEISDLDFSDKSLMGLLLGLVGSVCASMGNMVVTRNQRAGMPMVQSNAVGFGYGAIFCLLMLLGSGKSLNLPTEPIYWVTLIHLSVIGTVLAFGAYFSLIKAVGAGLAAYPLVVVPIVALMISQVWEGFTWTAHSVFGVTLILLGNVIVLANKR